MASKFYCKVYFYLESLKFFYNNRPKEIIEFYEKIKKSVDAKNFTGISFTKGFREVYTKFKLIDKSNNDIFKKLLKDFADFAPSTALEIFYLNYILLDKFIDSNIDISENSIRQFLIKNISKINTFSILSTHEFYRKSEYYREKILRPFIFTVEANEFIIEYFDQLFLSDEGYTLGIFIFLDGIVKKYGLGNKLGIFKSIYLKGKQIMEKEYTKEELKEVVKYHIKKREDARDFV